MKYREFWWTYDAHPAGIKAGDYVVFTSSKNRMYRERVRYLRRGRPVIQLDGIAGWALPLNSIVIVERNLQPIWTANADLMKQFAIRKLRHVAA